MKKFLVFVFVSIIASCSTGQNKSVRDHILSELNIEYNNAKSFFGKEMVSHLPTKLDSSNITFTENFSPEFGNLELMVINRVKESQLIDVISEFERNAIYSCWAGDSCLLIVNRFASRNNYYHANPSEQDLSVIDRECYMDKLPIPNFWHNEFTTDITDCHLPEDFKIYVIEAEPGLHFEEQYLTDGKFMPVSWENGYSKGVALSSVRRVIIYWIIIW